MIIFIENGRLGNQLFQYCGFRHYFPQHKLIFFGCEALRRIFEPADALFVPRKGRVWGFLFEILRIVFSLLATIRLLGEIKEDANDKEFGLVISRGILFNIYFARNVFFQHHSFIAQNRIVPGIKFSVIQKAHDWLESRGVFVDKSSLVFVHIRRTDYLHWPSSEFPAVLNIGWYRRAIATVLSKAPRSVFVVMGDDLHYLRDMFEESEWLLISDNPPEVDLAIMSLCDSGILSASSYAWWGAYLARATRKAELFIAPRYWAGHREKKWYPPGFITDWLMYQE